MTCEANVCGTGGWSGPKPGDPDNNSILSATPAFGGIDVSWTYPSTNPFAVAHVLVYRGVSADYMGAIYLATVSGSLYYDKTDIEMPIEYFYWIRLVSINGTYGELIGPASAVARPSIERTIEQLTGKIDAGVLAQSLRAELDQISILNGNLLNEVTARENGEITLAQALADVDGGVAQALTFIHQEINSRVTADSAQAENLNLVATTLGDEMAAATTSMTAEIDAVTGTVNAMYTAKVNVNGLIGGFGLANDGLEVEAGFDVDTFWVGRTGANKRKPFTISGQETFIDEAVINKLTFSKLRADDGSLIVEGGKVKANFLQVTNASIEGALYSSNWVYGVSGWYLDKSGALYANSGEFRGQLVAASGTFSGSLTASAVNAVNTINIANNAVSASNAASGVNPSVTLWVPAGATVRVFVISTVSGGTMLVDLPISFVSVSIDGNASTSAFSNSLTGGSSGSGSTSYVYVSGVGALSESRVISGGEGRNVAFSASNSLGLPQTIAVFGMFR